jgi:hypothetical protein
VQGFGQARQNRSGIGSSFRSSPAAGQVTGAGGSTTIINPPSTGAAFPLEYQVNDQGTKGSATINHDLNLPKAHELKVTLSGDVTINFINYPASGTAIDWLVQITQDSTGGHTITWPSEITPAISLGTSADSVSLVSFHTDDGGTIVRPVLLLNASFSGVQGATKQLDNLASPVANVAISMGSNKITSLADPTSAQDAATKAYVDSLSFSGFATPELDNLTTTSINANLTPQAGKLLGSSSIPWSSTFSNNYKMGTAGVIDSTLNQISGLSTGMALNVPSSKVYDFQVAGVSQATLSSGGLLAAKALQVTSTALSLNDATSYAGINGDIYREGNDVKVFTGGAEVNLSSLAGATRELDNLTTTAINTDLLFDAATYDIGDSTNMVDNLNVNTVRLRNSSGISNIPSLNSPGGSILNLNFPLASSMTISENGTSKYTFSATTFTTPNIIISGSAAFSDLAAYPTISGSMNRNGSTISMFSPIFEVKNDTSVATEQATLNITKVDGSPLDDENIGRLQFVVRDGGVETVYAGVRGVTDDVTNSGALVLEARADNSLSTAMVIYGDDNNTVFAFGAVDQSRIFPITGNMLFSVKAQTGLGDFSSNVGNEGTLIIPFINDGSPSFNDLNQAFGGFDGAIGLDIADDKLYVRNGATYWNYYSPDGTVP